MAANRMIKGTAAEPSPSEMASLHQELDAVHSQIVNWSSSEGGSGSKTGPEPAPEEEEDEFVTRSTVRRGHKRELEFALQSQGEVSGSSLSRTRSKTKSNKTPRVGEPSVPARRADDNVGPTYPAEARAVNVGPLTKVPTNPEELIASGWIDGASIKLVNDDEENGLLAMIENARIFCSCDTCKSFTAISLNEFRQHGGCPNGDIGNFIYFENNKTMSEAMEAINGDSMDLIKLSLQEVVGPFPQKRTYTCQDCGDLYETSRIGDFMLHCCSCLQMKRVRSSPSTSIRNNVIKSSLKRKSQHKVTSEKLTKKNMGLHKLVFMSDILPEGTKMWYDVDGKGKLKLEGERKGTGILCSHCSQVVTPSKFEQHAKQGQRRKPYNHIYISEDVTLHDLSVTLSKEENSTCYKGCVGRLHLVKHDEVCQVTLKVDLIFYMLRSRFRAWLLWKSTQQHKTYLIFIEVNPAYLMFISKLMYEFGPLPNLQEQQKTY